MQPEINLYDLIGLGLIIELPTGILVSNQTGGTACLQPSLQGIFVPISNDIYLETNEVVSPANDLEDYFMQTYETTGATYGIRETDANVIDSILQKYSLSDFISVDKTKLSQSHEAWIWIDVNPASAQNQSIKGLTGNLKGVITWANSD